MTSMGRRLAISVLALIPGCLAGAPAAAAAGMINEFSACYDVRWNGISFARLTYSHAAAAGYHVTMHFETFGLADEFGKVRFAANSTGQDGGRTGPKPQRFEAIDGDHGLTRIRTTLTYPAGGAVRTEISPKPPKMPVAAARTTGAIDPLSALYRLRREASRALNGGRPAFVIPIYDGAKRYDLHATLGERGTRKIGKGFRPVVHVKARLSPIAGFEAGERARFSEDALDIYLSTDGYFVPVEIAMGAAKATLTRLETGGRRCDG